MLARSQGGASIDFPSLPVALINPILNGFIYLFFFQKKSLGQRFQLR